MSSDDFLWLQSWYHKQCDGDWEHQENIRISTIDNPGWSITINLNETKMQDVSFNTNQLGRTENAWFICFIKNNKFEGRCGAENLSEVLKIFRNWVEKNEAELSID